MFFEKETLFAFLLFFGFLGVASGGDAMASGLGCLVMAFVEIQKEKVEVVKA